MTRVLLILAGPTVWDAEGRLCGSHSLPLSDEAPGMIRALADSIPHAVSAVYTNRNDEACDQAAKIVAGKFSLRVRDSEALDSISLGLWQGLTCEELRFRFPTIFPAWEEDALAVQPPEGESVQEAAERIRQGLRKILRRNRGVCIALVMRPMAMRLAAGLLRKESILDIARHLHDPLPMETIDVPDVAPRDLSD